MTDTIRIEGTTYILLEIIPRFDCDIILCQRFEDQRPQGERQRYLYRRLPKGAIEKEQ